MKKDEDPKLWVTALKLLIGAVVLIGGVGLGLWLADQLGLGGDLLTAPAEPWGIAHDSPVRMRR